MNEQFLAKFPQDFTQPLLKVCAAPAPMAAFVSRLERQLLDRQALILASGLRRRAVERIRKQFSVSVARHRWQYALTMVFVALTLAVLAIGPRRVLAQVERWLGYVPGIGFVDLSDTRVLASPVEITRDNITLRVEKVITEKQRTKVIISVPGLTEQDLPWPNEGSDNPDFSAALLLPDGSRLDLKASEYSIGSAKLEFPGLPAGIHQLSLLVPRLPLIPAGYLPEGWEVPLTLLPANGDLIEELFPQPYSPLNASDTHNGITLSILNVAQTSSETAVQYQVTWTKPEWDFSSLGWMNDPVLRDDLGHKYDEHFNDSNGSVAVAMISAPEESQVTSTQSTPSHTDMLVFPVLSLSASQATLQVETIEFSTPAPGSFNLDMGENPQIGDSWPLDIHLDALGFPVHITSATLVNDSDVDEKDQTILYPSLKLEMDPITDQNGLRLTMLDFDNQELGIFGLLHDDISDGMLTYSGSIRFPEGNSIPSGVIQLHTTWANLMVNGPWEATWTIPGKDPANPAQPVRIFPTPEAQPINEIRPVLEEVFLSDRISAIKLGAVGMPTGGTFMEVLPYNPLSTNPISGLFESYYLEDNLGYRYGHSDYEVSIEQTGGDSRNPDPRWEFFSPLKPYAQKASLSVPWIELAVPGQAIFTVELPQGLALKEGQYTSIERGSGQPDHQVSRSYWVSDPWPVDISFDLAGFHFHFTEARVVHEKEFNPLYQLALSGKPPANTENGMQVFQMLFSAVTRPDGKIIQNTTALQNHDMVTYPYGTVNPTGLFSNEMQALIILDVTADNQTAFLAGRYEAELNGAVVLVKGPWTLDFSISP